MVDEPPKRIAPAPSPDDYKTFADWLGVATERRGMSSELARYCGVERQNSQRWIDGSLPTGPMLRKKIAEWAQVDYEALRNLFDRDEEARMKAPVKVRKSKRARLRAVSARARS